MENLVKGIFIVGSILIMGVMIHANAFEEMPIGALFFAFAIIGHFVVNNETYFGKKEVKPTPKKEKRDDDYDNVVDIVKAIQEGKL